MTCFVPNCNSGYESCKGQRHLFKVKDRQVESWSRMLPKREESFNSEVLRCHLHFDERFILRSYKHVINGKEVEIERGKWHFTEDAIPTIFANLPSYFTCSLPKQRTSPASRKKSSRSFSDNNTEVKAVNVEDDNHLELTSTISAAGVSTASKTASVPSSATPTYFRMPSLEAPSLSSSISRRSKIPSYRERIKQKN